MISNKNIKSRILKSILLFVYMLFGLISFSQTIPNLVNNYSFEDTIKCPISAGQVNFSKYWFDPTGGSSDYFNSCAYSHTLSLPNATIVAVPQNMGGYQFPRTGNAYCGFATYANGFSNGREYIKNRLKYSLTNSKTYCVTFYVNRVDSCTFASANIGAYFSNDSMMGPAPPYLINVTPDIEETTIINDTVNWVQVQGTYLSNGNYNFITIGNFRDDANTAFSQTKPISSNPINYFKHLSYYHIDDVSVVEINPATAAIKDSLISRCFMDSVILGTDSTEFATYTWQSTAAGLAALSCTNCPNPSAKPLVTTKYYLTKQQCSATTIDSVTVVVLTPTTQANAGNDANLCPNDILQLGTADSAAFVSYSWQFIGNSSLSCTNCAMPLANVQETTEFILQRTECNVITTDTVNVIIDLCDITIPTVFTPNADEVNDVWKFKLPTGAKLNELNIYNRWGLLVYSVNSSQLSPNSERSTLNLQWDGYTTAGIACTEGVYFYTLSYTDKKGEAQNLKGFVSLFR